MKELCKTEGIERNNEQNKKETLFDINLNIIEDKIHQSEQNLSVVVTLINLGIPGKVNANLHYRILGSSGEIVYEEEEVIPVETQIEFIKTIDTVGLMNGNYKLLVDLSYTGQTEPARAEAGFSIGEGFLFEHSSGIFLFALICILSALIFSISFLLFRALIKKAE